MDFVVFRSDPGGIEHPLKIRVIGTPVAVVYTPNSITIRSGDNSYSNPKCDGTENLNRRNYPKGTLPLPRFLLILKTVSFVTLGDGRDVWTCTVVSHLEFHFECLQ